MKNANTFRAELPLVKIEKGGLCMWSLSDMQWKQTTLNYPLMHAESFVRMDATLFCSNCHYYAGKWQLKNSQQFAYEIERNGAVTRLPNMLLRRENRVLWWYSTGKQVLAFGGIENVCECDRNIWNTQEICVCYLCSSLDRGAPENRECEALIRHSSSWRALPRMELSQIVYSVCEYLQYIYMCGGHLIEMFDPKNCLFLHPLSIFHLMLISYLLITTSW